MYLTRHRTPDGARWARDGRFLPRGLKLSALLTLPRSTFLAVLEALPPGEAATGDLLPPVEPEQEVWGSGVTYLRSREARKAESTTADVYEKVYDAARPEIFFKSAGWRAVGHGQPVRIRQDTRWNVPEPELTLVINAQGEIVGYTVGNDMSSRDIEGENPLYLPQAKTYNGSCAVGPGIHVATPDDLTDLTIRLEIRRGGEVVFAGDTATSNMKRPFQELVDYLYRELDFPAGALLMTGTGIVPPDDFTLAHGDLIRIAIGDTVLENTVA
ncbi:MAG: fumarylacetoacetate hydrolase [Litorilinea sp.]|nr:MAG: fumarylacetoacetate hydrolase [Litorilinea sp.]